MTQPLGPNQKKWIEALRSGKYKQGKGSLNCNNEYFCCLGVACEVLEIPKEETNHGIYYNGNASIMPFTGKDQLKLNSCCGNPKDGGGEALTGLNDSSGYSFQEIADVLEANPELYFTEPA